MISTFFSKLRFWFHYYGVLTLSYWTHKRYTSHLLLCVPFNSSWREKDPVLWFILNRPSSLLPLSHRYICSALSWSTASAHPAPTLTILLLNLRLLSGQHFHHWKLTGLFSLGSNSLFCLIMEGLSPFHHNGLSFCTNTLAWTQDHFLFQSMRL